MDWFRSTKSQSKYFHTLYDVQRTKSYKYGDNNISRIAVRMHLRVIIDMRENESILVIRNYVKLPEISSQVLGIFSLFKFITFFLKKTFYYYHGRFAILNHIFDYNENSNSRSPKNQFILNPSSDLGSENLLLKNNKKIYNATTPKNNENKISFVYCDNWKFLLCCKTDKTKVKKKLFDNLIEEILCQYIYLPSLIKHTYDNKILESKKNKKMINYLQNDHQKENYNEYENVLSRKDEDINIILIKK